MALYENLSDFFDVIINDEDLMRLIYYPAINATDDPLSPKKANLVNSDVYFKDILKQRVLRAPKADGLVDGNDGICRICMYMGSSTRTFNTMAFNQRINFDIFVHINKYEMVDSRSMRIIDRLNQIINNQRISGMGKVQSVTFSPITAPPGYIGYSSEYMFGTTK